MSTHATFSLMFTASDLAESICTGATRAPLPMSRASGQLAVAADTHRLSPARLVSLRCEIHDDRCAITACTCNKLPNEQKRLAVCA